LRREKKGGAGKKRLWGKGGFYSQKPSKYKKRKVAIRRCPVLLEKKDQGAGEESEGRGEGLLARYPYDVAGKNCFGLEKVLILKEDCPSGAGRAVIPPPHVRKLQGARGKGPCRNLALSPETGPARETFSPSRAPMAKGKFP